MRTSKELFQASPAFGHYEALLNNPAFESACGAAMADFVESLPGSAAEPSKAWDSYLQILGARAVLEKLSQLHTRNETTKPEPPSWQYPKPKGT
jgi:hypothetical protein